MLSEPGTPFLAQDGNQRLKHTYYVVPIRYGTDAFYLGKKATETRSHQWTIYVAGAHGHDISHVLRAVTFKLHNSFPDPVRTIRSPPWELTEVGWGEFDIGITLHFSEDSKEREVDLFHHLRLHAESEGAVVTTRNNMKHVSAESYDELVFVEPVVEFYQRIKDLPPRVAPPSRANVEQVFGSFQEEEDVKLINAARHQVAQKRAVVIQQLEAVQHQALQAQLGKR